MEGVYEKDFLHDDPKKKEIDIAFDLLKTVVEGFHSEKDDKRIAAYCSSPITTGRRMFNVFINYGAKSVKELNQIDKLIFFNEILNPNILEAKKFTEKIRNEGAYIINPSEFMATDWNQSHYTYLWYRIIYNLVRVLRFNKDWEYSNGCVKEYIRAFELQSGEYNYPYSLKELKTKYGYYSADFGTNAWQERWQNFRRKKGILTQDNKSEELYPYIARRKIANAILFLYSYGFDFKTLLEFYQRLNAQIGVDKSRSVQKVNSLIDKYLWRLS